MYYYFPGTCSYILAKDCHSPEPRYTVWVSYRCFFSTLLCEAELKTTVYKTYLTYRVFLLWHFTFSESTSARLMKPFTYLLFKHEKISKIEMRAFWMLWFFFLLSTSLSVLRLPPSSSTWLSLCLSLNGRFTTVVPVMAQCTLVLVLSVFSFLTRRRSTL